MSTRSGPPQNDDHRIGDTLRDGRFAVTGKLGEGGQAATFDAIDKRDGRRVTLKRFRVRGASSWKEVELAEREAKVLAHVAHPGLPVYVDHFEEGGSLYLVTEHIEGETVARMRQRGPVSEDEVLRFLADAASALDYLHGRSPPLVHRDIKPSNVIRRPDGSFAIIDFGAVRDRLKTTGSTVVGTFGYMAPEQFQGRAMPCSDVYAVGATAVAMLTGSEPEDLPHKGLAIDVAASLPRARPALVAALEAMVEPDPDRRAAGISPLLGGLRGREQSIDDAGEQVRRAAAEIGATFMRVVDEVSKSGAKDLKREARRAAEIARRAVKERRRIDRREPPRSRGAPLGGPVLLVVLLALTAVQLAVLLALRIVTPIVLYVVSALFLGSVPGRAMRSAAGAVSEAGKRAVTGIGRAKDAVRGRAPAATHVSRVDRAGRARIEDAPAPLDDEPRAEEEAAAEEEAHRRESRKRS